MAAGSKQVLIDIPVGPTAKVRSQATAQTLKHLLEQTGAALGLDVRTVITDGSQPIGRGIGPALEARDVLQVLRNDGQAPQDLREKSLQLAGVLLEMGDKAAPGQGYALAQSTLLSGQAMARFEAICLAQGALMSRNWPITATLSALNGPASSPISIIAFWPGWRRWPVPLTPAVPAWICM